MLVDRAGARALARGEQRGERAARSGVLDDPAARRGRAEPVGQPQQVDQPVEHMGLELGARGARCPQHALHTEPRGQQVAEDRRARGIRGKVRKEVRRLPVGEAGDDDLVNVAQHVGERLTVLGCRAGQPPADGAGLRAREHRIALDLLHVARNTLDERVPASPELLRRHVNGVIHTGALFPGRGGAVAHYSTYRSMLPSRVPGAGCGRWAAWTRTNRAVRTEVIIVHRGGTIVAACTRKARSRRWPIPS